MSFRPDEFFVGMIAYFTIKQFRKDTRIGCSQLVRDNKARPFVCYAESGDAAYWTAFTGTWHRDRRCVSRKWLRNAKGQFLRSDPIIADGGCTFVGPISAFAELSQKHDNFNGMYRPHLTPEGVEEVDTIVRGRGGMTPAPALAGAA